MEIQVEHLECTRSTGRNQSAPSNPVYHQRQVQYINKTRYSVMLKDRQGRCTYVESHLELSNGESQLGLNGSSSYLPMGDNMFTVVEMIRMTAKAAKIELNRLRPQYDAGKLNRYLMPWYETLSSSEPMFRNARDHAAVHLHIHYTYDIHAELGETSLNTDRCIYLREHDIVMTISNHISTSGSHPVDLASVADITGDLLGDRFDDESTTMVGIKLVDNSSNGYLGDRFINIGGEALRIKPVQDTFLPDGMNVVLAGPGVRDGHQYKLMCIEEATKEFPLYASPEAAISRGDEKDYSRRITDARKAEQDAIAYRNRNEQDYIKRKQDLNTVISTRVATIIKSVKDGHQQRQIELNARLQASHAKLREKTDVFKTVIGLVTGILGLLTLVAKVK